MTLDTARTSTDPAPNHAASDPVPPGSTGDGDAITPDHGSGGGSGLTRITVNLTRQAMRALEALVRLTGYSKTDNINRALRLAAVLQPIFDRNEGTLTVLDESSGKVERIHFL